MTENQPTVNTEESRPPHVNLQSTLEDPEIEERINYYKYIECRDKNITF